VLRRFPSSFLLEQRLIDPPPGATPIDPLELHRNSIVPVVCRDTLRGPDMLIRIELDLGLLELPRRDTTLEQDVELVVTSVLEFGESEVRPDEREAAERCPKESCLP
jgi:hypothetical protein